MHLRRERLDTLVGVLPTKRDREILLRERWYRIPKDVRRPRSPTVPEYLAFYEPARLTPTPGVIRFAEVLSVSEATREELMPGQPSGTKSGRRYNRYDLGPIEELPRPIPLTRPRPLAFIGTSRRRLFSAESINDLFYKSPLEDLMWRALRRDKIPAERQWEERIRGRTFLLDFALFCHGGNIDVETDGDSYHVTPQSAAADNERNNLLAGRWRVLRFTSAEITGRIDRCVDQVKSVVNELKGLADDGLSPRRFSVGPGEPAVQLGLF